MIHKKFIFIMKAVGWNEVQFPQFIVGSVFILHKNYAEIGEWLLCSLTNTACLI